MSSTIKIEQLFVGIPKTLEGIQQETAINRDAVESLTIKFDEIIGDRVANLEHHGGDNRVLHHFALEDYDLLQSIYPDVDFCAGSIGENLSARGMNEANVCIGDSYQIGNVQCMVTEPRKPCGLISQKYKTKGLARKIQDKFVTGWFYKILKEGDIFVGDEIKLLSRPYPKLTLKKCIDALLLTADPEVLKLMAETPVLSDNWKLPAKTILKSGRLEDDTLRLGE